VWNDLGTCWLPPARAPLAAAAASARWPAAREV